MHAESDDDVCVVDSSSREDSGGRTCSDRGSRCGGSAGLVATPTASALAAAAAPMAPQLRAPAVDVGTLTEETVPGGTSVRLCHDLGRLAHALGASDSPNRRDRKRAAVDSPAVSWRATLSRLRRLSRGGRHAPTPPAEEYNPSGGLSMGHGGLTGAAPEWLAPLHAALDRAVAAAPVGPAPAAAEGASTTPAASFLLSRSPPRTGGGGTALDAHVPPPHSLPKSARAEGSEAASAVLAVEQPLLSAADRALLSEARLILAREGAQGLLPLYAELTSLRSAARAEGRALAEDAAERLGAQGALFQLMADALEQELREQQREARRCGMTAAGVAPTPVPTLHARLDELARIGRTLGTIRRAGERVVLAPSGVVAAPAPALELSVMEVGVAQQARRGCTGGHRHGLAFEAFQCAQEEEQRVLREAVESLRGQLEEARAVARQWEDRYESVAARLRADVAVDNAASIPPDVYKVLRDKSRGAMANLARLLGWRVGEMTGWRAVLHPDAVADGVGSMTVDLATGEVLEGAAPQPRPPPAETHAVGAATPTPTHSTADPPLVAELRQSLAAPDLAEEPSGSPQPPVNPIGAATCLPLDAAARLAQASPPTEELPSLPVSPALPAAAMGCALADVGVDGGPAAASAGDEEAPLELGEEAPTVAFSNDVTLDTTQSSAMAEGALAAPLSEGTADHGCQLPDPPVVAESTEAPVCGGGSPANARETPALAGDAESAAVAKEVPALFAENELWGSESDSS